MMSELLTEVTFTWCDDDVIQQAKDMGIKDLTPIEIDKILYLMKRKHDACIGMNWDVIGSWINFIIEERNSDTVLR